MRRRRRNIGSLAFGLVGFAVLGWFIITFEPTSWQKIAVFFFILFLSSIFVSQYLLKNTRRALLISVGLTVFLLLRLLNLREPIYLILLITTIASLEVLFQKR